MLTAERSRQFDQTLDLLSKRGHISPETEGIVYKEHYATQMALLKLGMTAEDPPAKLPHINELVLPYEEKPITDNHITEMIEIGGIPRGGKTSAIKHVLYNFHPLNLIGSVTDEAKVTQFLESSGETSLFAINRIRQEIYRERFEQLHKLMLQEEMLKVPIISDRFLVDNSIMARALLLAGEIPADEQIYERHQKPLKWPAIFEETGEYGYGFILCLIPPDLAIEREGERTHPPKVMSLELQTKLYEQYLRFHYEMVTQRPFHYACLDFTQGNLDENQSNFGVNFAHMLVMMNPHINHPAIHVTKIPDWA